MSEFAYGRKFENNIKIGLYNFDTTNCYEVFVKKDIYVTRIYFIYDTYYEYWCNSTYCSKQWYKHRHITYKYLKKLLLDLGYESIKLC